MGERRWPLRIGWIGLAVVSLGITGFGVVIAIAPMDGDELLLALIPYRRRERWAWTAL